MSAVLSALRSTVAMLLGVVLVLYECAIVRSDRISSHATMTFDRELRARPVVPFDKYPPEAWAAP